MSRYIIINITLQPFQQINRVNQNSSRIHKGKSNNQKEKIANQYSTPQASRCKVKFNYYTRYSYWDVLYSGSKLFVCDFIYLIFDEEGGSVAPVY